MLDDLSNGVAVILFGIFYLAADVTWTFSFPDHRHPGRRQMPSGRARRHVQSGDILFLMTGAALLAELALAGDAAFHVLRVNVIVVALSGIVSCGMAIQTTRMFEHGNDRSEEFAGLGIVSFKAGPGRNWLSNQAERDHEEYDHQKFEL